MFCCTVQIIARSIDSYASDDSTNRCRAQGEEVLSCGVQRAASLQSAAMTGVSVLNKSSISLTPAETGEKVRQ